MGPGTRLVDRPAAPPIRRRATWPARSPGRWTSCRRRPTSSYRVTGGRARLEGAAAGRGARRRPRRDPPAAPVRDGAPRPVVRRARPVRLTQVGPSSPPAVPPPSGPAGGPWGVRKATFMTSDDMKVAFLALLPRSLRRRAGLHALVGGLRTRVEGRRPGRRRPAPPPGPRRPRCARRATLARSSVMNARPSSDTAQASESAGFGTPGAPRCPARPSRPPSHPRPTAPGPNRSQNSSSTCPTCSRVSTVPPAGAGSSRTSMLLTSPPNSQVAANDRGGSQRSTTPPALPCSW